MFFFGKEKVEILLNLPNSSDILGMWQKSDFPIQFICLSVELFIKASEWRKITSL